MIRNWTKYYLEEAKRVASMSSCIRRKVGAVLVKDRRIIATGYNGTLSDMEECDTHWCGVEDIMQPFHKEWSSVNELHAEQSVLIDLCKRKVWEPAMTLYITCLPCPTCALSLIAAGIRTIYYTGERATDMRAIDIFSKHGVRVYDQHSI